MRISNYFNSYFYYNIDIDIDIDIEHYIENSRKDILIMNT